MNWKNMKTGEDKSGQKKQIKTNEQGMKIYL